ncbi:MAG: N-acetyl-gamma-glutamyl-phosphate reductase [Leptospiraceae bacterium]|nr:N-acetyl-gamma-glutamyl-phosphate reductase [Leptospiraceae bacterium]MDW7977102.1 N-acetyl-gamma-glutamyl-phosphate reductase [Leptospiraceae bacterium]
MTEIAILGAGGFTGKELLRLLRDHSFIKPVHITSNAYKGKKVKDIFPELAYSKIGDLVFQSHQEKIPSGIPVILATPNQESMELVHQLFHENRIIVDLSGAYRLDSLLDFQKFYGFEHKYPELLKHKVYGMTEIYREQIQKTRLVSNPGCYPTSILIPLYYFRKYLAGVRAISIDSKSGVSGAGGRVEDGGFSFSNVYENFRAYKVLQHQHEPEILQYLKDFSGFSGDLTFVPHLLPIFRGILSTIFIHWNDVLPNDKELITEIKQQIQNEPFVRFYDTPESIDLRKVQQTNYCDFSFRTKGKTTVIVCAIDNLVKGAAGQALQNLNLMLGYEETEGLL